MRGTIAGLGANREGGEREGEARGVKRALKRAQSNESAPSEAGCGPAAAASAREGESTTALLAAPHKRGLTLTFEAWGRTHVRLTGDRSWGNSISLLFPFPSSVICRSSAAEHKTDAWPRTNR